jgi:DNA-binding CsgD family transcriptional regulator
MQQRQSARFACDAETIASVIDSVRWHTVVSQLRLSRRERQIVEAMLYGMDTEVRIADRLQMSPRTVQTHVQRLRQKMGATSREQLLATMLVACLAGDVEET